MHFQIVSGGQTGVDRASLDLALEFGIPISGWCPKGFKAEDGTIDPKYNLKETPTDVYAERTEWNARDSDGTLILLYGEAEGGTAWTIECAQKYSRPIMVVQMEEPADLGSFLDWIETNQIKILNIAGPRESLSPGNIYRLTKQTLKQFLEALD
jgi:Circularly permutated YpsA SLOG family